MNINNSVDLKPNKHLMDYVIFECARLKILPSGQFYPGENSRFTDKPPLALVLRIVTSEICIVLVEKKREISIPLEQLCRFSINEKRDIELEVRRNFKKVYYEYPLGELDYRIQIAIDPLKGFLDETTTLIFSPCDYVEDERFIKLGNEMKRLRFNKSKERQIPQLNQLQVRSNNLQHNESLENEINIRRYNQSINEHKRSLNQELQHTCERSHHEQPSIIGGRGKPIEVIANAQNVLKEPRPKEEPVVESVESRNASIAEWINKTNTENIMDLPMAPPTIKPRKEETTQLEKQVNNLCITPVVNGASNSLLDMDIREIINLVHNNHNNIESVPKLINRHKEVETTAFTDKQHESEDTYSEGSDIWFVAESQLYITFAFLVRSYAIVIPYETSLKDLISTIEQRYNVKVNRNNFYFKNAVNDRISIMDEEDWLVARLEAKEAMNNKLVLHFS